MGGRCRGREVKLGLMLPVAARLLADREKAGAGSDPCWAFAVLAAPASA